MGILPTNQSFRNTSFGRNRQPMNYATGGMANNTGGGGQPLTPAQPVTPQLNMGFGMPNSAYANARMRPGYGMPQGYMRGINIAPQPLPMRFQQAGINPMAGQLAGPLGNMQIPAGKLGQPHPQKVQDLAARLSPDDVFTIRQYLQSLQGGSGGGVLGGAMRSSKSA